MVLRGFGGFVGSVLATGGRLGMPFRGGCWVEGLWLGWLLWLLVAVVVQILEAIGCEVSLAWGRCRRRVV